MVAFRARLRCIVLEYKKNPLYQIYLFFSACHFSFGIGYPQTLSLYLLSVIERRPFNCPISIYIIYPKSLILLTMHPTLLLLALLPSLAIAEQLPSFSINPRGLDRLNSRQTEFRQGQGATCAIAFGTGYEFCPGGDGRGCYNRAAGRICCLDGTNCPSNTYCTVDEHCCPNVSLQYPHINYNG